MSVLAWLALASRLLGLFCFGNILPLAIDFLRLYSLRDTVQQLAMLIRMRSPMYGNFSEGNAGWALSHLSGFPETSLMATFLILKIIFCLLFGSICWFKSAGIARLIMKGVPQS